MSDNCGQIKKSWWEDTPPEGFSLKAEQETRKSQLLPSTQEYLLSVMEKQNKDQNEGWNE